MLGPVTLERDLVQSLQPWPSWVQLSLWTDIAPSSSHSLTAVLQTDTVNSQQVHNPREQHKITELFINNSTKFNVMSYLIWYIELLEITCNFGIKFSFNINLIHLKLNLIPKNNHLFFNLYYWLEIFWVPYLKCQFLDNFQVVDKLVQGGTQK